MCPVLPMSCETKNLHECNSPTNDVFTSQSVASLSIVSNDAILQEPQLQTEEISAPKSTPNSKPISSSDNQSHLSFHKGKVIA